MTDHRFIRTGIEHGVGAGGSRVSEQTLIVEPPITVDGEYLAAVQGTGIDGVSIREVDGVPDQTTMIIEASSGFEAYRAAVVKMVTKRAIAAVQFPELREGLAAEDPSSPEASFRFLNEGRLSTRAIYLGNITVVS